MYQVKEGDLKGLYVHDPDKCAGEFCSVHNPSNHVLRDAPRNYRLDRGIMERVCEHGVGHDDPDDLAFRRKMNYADCSGTHGCDGCCFERDAR